MLPEDRKQKYQEQTDELYRAYGKFAVSFEHVCFNIHNLIASILSSAGLRDQQVTNVLLAGMTAEPLRGLLIGLVGQTKTLSTGEGKILKNLMQRFQKLIDARNDVIHSTWFIGYANDQDTDFSNASGFKHHRSKNGASTKSLDVTATYFDGLSLEATELASLLMRLNGCFVFGHSIERNFVIDGHGNAHCPADKA